VIGCEAGWGRSEQGEAAYELALLLHALGTGQLKGNALRGIAQRDVGVAASVAAALSERPGPLVSPTDAMKGYT